MVDGIKVTPQKSGSEYFVKVMNIPAAELGNAHTITVSDTAGTASYSINYSALSYCHSALKNSKKDSLKNLSRALYLYNKKAKSYFSS